MLLTQLLEQSKGADTYEAGIGVWEKLMTKIGRRGDKKGEGSTCIELDQQIAC